MKYDILDVINQIIRDGSGNSVSNSIQSTENLIDNDHFIISLKFYKFVIA